ncbi:MAG: ATP-binding cassette domain-containing protein [Thermoplasmata archaeon]
MEEAILTRNLTRVFGGKPRRLQRKREAPKEVVALDSVDLDVAREELFGLLGPNGAGKTTLIKILATLLLPTSGEAYVAGYDVSKDPFPIRKKINMVSGGETSGYGLLTTRENIWMFSQFYGIPSRQAKEEIDRLLHEFDLWDRRDAKVRTISTGERQKMNMIRGFVTDPEIVFLDEPTLGLDVNAARSIRKFIQRWIQEQDGKTVLMTTHYMMEADELCDRIAIIDRGRILACDTPERLKRMVKRDVTLKIETNRLKDTNVFRPIAGIKNFAVSEDAKSNSMTVTFILEDETPIAEIMSEVLNQGSKVHSLRKTEPTLEEVFISLVGRGLE